MSVEKEVVFSRVLLMSGLVEAGVFTPTVWGAVSASFPTAIPLLTSCLSFAKYGVQDVGMCSDLNRGEVVAIAPHPTPLVWFDCFVHLPDLVLQVRSLRELSSCSFHQLRSETRLALTLDVDFNEQLYLTPFRLVWLGGGRG